MGVIRIFWLLSLFWVAVIGWRFSLQTWLTRQMFPHPVSDSSAKMLSSSLHIYKENILLVSMPNLKPLNTTISIFPWARKNMVFRNRNLYSSPSCRQLSAWLCGHVEMHSQERIIFLLLICLPCFLQDLQNLLSSSDSQSNTLLARGESHSTTEKFFNISW